MDENLKIDNGLNLAFDVSEEDRTKSINLNEGYLGEDRWEVIIRYIGNIDRISKQAISVTLLLNNFAIIIATKDNVSILSTFPEIVYIEKPRRIYFEVLNSIRTSCISPVQSQLELFGEGIMISFIDSGIDYFNSVFLDQNNISRIDYILDQTDNSGTPPVGYNIGTLYTNEAINSSIETRVPLKTRDLSGHGTAVASVAAGNLATTPNSNIGIATKSRIMAVKLGNPLPNSFPKSSELMQAIDFSIRTAIEINIPLVINISFGNTYGSHDGTTPFSTATEIYFDFIPTGDYIDSGIYQFVFTPVRLILGEINMWLPVESALNNTTFLNPSPEVTLTVPSTALRVISVGAYDAYLGKLCGVFGAWLFEGN